LIALVSLIRKVSGADETVTTGYDKTVDKNFQIWVFKKQAVTTTKFTEAQMQWLRMIKGYVTSSFHLKKKILNWTLLIRRVV
jgi:type I restriction enzyme R subunit